MNTLFAISLRDILQFALFALFAVSALSIPIIQTLRKRSLALAQTVCAPALLTQFLSFGALTFIFAQFGAQFQVWTIAIIAFLPLGLTVSAQVRRVLSEELHSLAYLAYRLRLRLRTMRKETAQTLETLYGSDAMKSAETERVCPEIDHIEVDLLAHYACALYYTADPVESFGDIDLEELERIKAYLTDELGLDLERLENISEEQFTGVCEATDQYGLLAQFTYSRDKAKAKPLCACARALSALALCALSALSALALAPDSLALCAVIPLYFTRLMRDASGTVIYSVKRKEYGAQIAKTIGFVRQIRDMWYASVSLESLLKYEYSVTALSCRRAGEKLSEQVKRALSPGIILDNEDGVLSKKEVCEKLQSILISLGSDSKCASDSISDDPQFACELCDDLMSALSKHCPLGYFCGYLEFHPGVIAVQSLSEWTDEEDDDDVKSKQASADVLTRPKCLYSMDPIGLFLLSLSSVVILASFCADTLDNLAQSLRSRYAKWKVWYIGDDGKWLSTAHYRYSSALAQVKRINGAHILPKKF